MNTIVIWDQLGEQPLKFFTLSGDHRHLDRVYCNAANGDEKLMDEIFEIVYDEDGRGLVRMTEQFPPLFEGDFVIVCGFLP